LARAWRWFTGLGFDQEIPHHSTFSKNRHGRFQESNLFQEIFEEIVIRLRWNYRPDSDLFVIYTAGQRFASLVAVNPPQFYENRFAIKFTYSWRP
jgi:hypothetical protein